MNQNEIAPREIAAQTPSETQTPKMSLRARAGAAGKALIVYLGSGSIVLAIVAYLLFSSMGC